jgi:hypothetical protein
MMNSKQNFQITFIGQSFHVDVFMETGKPVYFVHLSGEPLFLTQTKGEDGKLFWTSVPEGRQALAAEIGALIEKVLDKPKVPQLF